MLYYEIRYNGTLLLEKAPAEFIDKFYGSPENWAQAYASESGLDRELDYNEELLETRTVS